MSAIFKMAAKTRHKNGGVKIQHCPISPKFDMWVDSVSGRFGRLHNRQIIIISCYYYYYYYSSSSSRCELVRPNSQRLMIQSLLNFTGRWIPISRGAFRSWNFQNGRRCHGNRERMSKCLTSFISKIAKGISTKLGIYIKECWQNILTKKKIANGRHFKNGRRQNL